MIRAIELDEIDEFDIRLKGSSAHFYSNPTKPMIWDYPGVETEWLNARKGNDPTITPEVEEIRRIVRRLNRTWPSTDWRPAYRPFDVMFQSGIHTEKSDYDIQFSSNRIFEKCQALARDRGEALFHPKYGFIRKELARSACPAIFDWADDQTTQLDRLVSVAPFSGDGPAKVDGATLSGHFRPTDWVLAP